MAKFIRVEKCENDVPGYVNVDRIRHMTIRPSRNLGFVIVLHLDYGTDIYDRYDNSEEAEDALRILVTEINS